MSENPMPSASYHVRRRHFVDRHIQGRLIAGLVLIEVVLFAAAMWFIYHEMQVAIDQQLFRVHRPAPGGGPVLLHALYQTIPWIVAVNLVALIGIDRIWGGHIRIIIDTLRRLAHQVAALDLRSPLHETGHDVLRQATRWLETEQTRCLQMRQIIQSLPDAPAEDDPQQRQRLEEQLKQLHQLLD